MSVSLAPRKALFTRSSPCTVVPVISLLRHRELLTSRRYASHSSSSKSHARPSSSAQPATSVAPSTSSTATTSIADDINPPPSTRPADLNLPDAIASSASAADKLKRYVAMGRAYLSFYKTGLKNVYHNYRASVPLRSSLGLTPYLPVSPPPSVKGGKAAAFRDAVHTLHLSRSNFQLIRRAAYDIRRMVPFTLMLIVCGEFTPLIVLALGSAVTPFTCRVPRQLEKDRAQSIARKRAALTAHEVARSGSLKSAAAGSEPELDLLARAYTRPAWIEAASAEEILRACATLGLVKAHTRPTALVSLLYRARLQRYAEYLDIDDRLIRRCGGVTAMEAAEVRIAVEERGGVGLAEGSEGWDIEREERRWLGRWLERREE